MKLWIVCRDCGSHDVRRDADSAWNAETQQWELNAVLDQGYCEPCDDESRLAEVEVIDDAQIPDAISKTGWFLNECEDGTYQVKEWHGDPDETGPFETLHEAYTWCLADKKLLQTHEVYTCQ